MTKPDPSAKRPVSLWAVALLFASSGFALVSAALLSAAFLPAW
jgi:hypothetical protein